MKILEKLNQWLWPIGTWDGVLFWLGVYITGLNGLLVSVVMIVALFTEKGASLDHIWFYITGTTSLIAIMGPTVYRLIWPTEPEHSS